MIELREFYENTRMREEVREYLIGFLHKKALTLDLTKTNEDLGAGVRGLKVAEEAITTAFSDLAILDNPNEKVAEIDSI